MSHNVTSRQQVASSYPFALIDGEHPYKKAVPKGYVEYQARYRAGGKLTYFNFDLAQEMGLIEKSHSHQITKKLETEFLNNFSLMIINEYDLLHGTQFPRRTIKSKKYMATRYLQLQHASRTGKTSGDGRSIWNGTWKKNGKTWDVSSWGTGVTQLSPGYAQAQRPIKSGSEEYSYGCGLAETSEAVESALLSEIFHRNGLRTERVLGIISYRNKTSVVVRAAPNFLRPSHVLLFLKQKDRESLKNIFDYLAERQTSNDTWALPRGDAKKYQSIAESFATDFGRMAALMEDEYVFCWIDWDGDNILIDGGVLDYGSVRQFGLFHYQYRYDDVERFSTRITEQRLKARYVVQNFAQAADFIRTGRKKPLATFANHSIVKLFDQQFEHSKNENILRKIGFNASQRKHLLKHNLSTVKKFRRAFGVFERAQSPRGVYRVADGVTRDALFCMRDILRELPKHAIQEGRVMTPEEFLKVIRSDYATVRTTPLTSRRKKQIDNYQKAYFQLIENASTQSDQRRTLAEVVMRSAIVNQYHRVTGNGLIHITDLLLRKKNHVSQNEFQRLMEDFIRYQTLVPEKHEELHPQKLRSQPARTIARSMIRLVRDHRFEV